MVSDGGTGGEGMIKVVSRRVSQTQSSSHQRQPGAWIRGRARYLDLANVGTLECQRLWMTVKRGFIVDPPSIFSPHFSFGIWGYMIIKPHPGFRVSLSQKHLVFLVPS
jgi:hypothetical protein